MHCNRCRSTIASAITLALGVAGVSQPASADIIDFSWTGYFRMLDPTGFAINNTSLTGKFVNQFETPINGTLQYDTLAKAGVASIQPFAFFNNPVPVTISGMNLQAVGNGTGGEGSLMVVNMLADWGYNYDIPVSLVWDAAGFFNSLPGIGVGSVIDQSVPGAVRGAADGTYVGGYGTHITSGYLDLGSVPIATTKWNTTPLCTPGGLNGPCVGVNPSGGLPLIADTTANYYDFNAVFMGGDSSNDFGIGGSPIPATSFENYYANFDVTTLTVTSIVTQVPVPGAAWLLGSGWLVLVGTARRAASGRTDGCLRCGRYLQ